MKELLPLLFMLLADAAEVDVEVFVRSHAREYPGTDVTTCRDPSETITV